MAIYYRALGMRGIGYLALRNEAAPSGSFAFQLRQTSLKKQNITILRSFKKPYTTLNTRSMFQENTTPCLK